MYRIRKAPQVFQFKPVVPPIAIDACGAFHLICCLLMQPILYVGDTDDLAPNQMFEINIGICRNESRRADAELIGDAVQCIPRPDRIAAHVFPTTVDGNADTGPHL